MKWVASPRSLGLGGFSRQGDPLTRLGIAASVVGGLLWGALVLGSHQVHGGKVGWIVIEHLSIRASLS